MSGRRGNARGWRGCRLRGWDRTGLVLEGPSRLRLNVARLSVGEAIEHPVASRLGVIESATADPRIQALWDSLHGHDGSADDEGLRGAPSTVLDIPGAVVRSEEDTARAGAGGRTLRVSVRAVAAPASAARAAGVVAIPKFTFDFAQRKLRNFGHWLLDCVPQVVALSSIAPSARFLLPSPLRGFQRATLELVGLPAAQAVAWDGAPVEAARLLVFESDGRAGGRPLSALLETRRLLTSRGTTASGKGTRRIYVSRRDADPKRRWVSNEPEVEALFASRGFEVLVMADCSLDDQIQHLSRRGGRGRRQRRWPGRHRLFGPRYARRGSAERQPDGVVCRSARLALRVDPHGRLAESTAVDARRLAALLRAPGGRVRAALSLLPGRRFDADRTAVGVSRQGRGAGGRGPPRWSRGGPRMKDETIRPAEVDSLRRELERLRGEARDLAHELDEAQRQSAQAVALALEESHVEARMEQLEGVLDLGPVTRHVRNAMARVMLVDWPCAHAVVEGLLPPAVHQAAVDAIPAPVFRADPREIALPPKPAPTYAVATWLFLNDVARDVMGPALVGRVVETSGEAPAARLKLSRSRLVARQEDGEPRLSPSKDGETLTVVVHLDQHYDWQMVFDWTDKPAPASRRRHGDIASWADPR